LRAKVFEKKKVEPKKELKAKSVQENKAAPIKLK
jgi:hypothetical protein